MKTIILLGELGKRFGRRHRLDVRTAAEAVRALAANFADFAGFVAGSRERGVAYRVLNDRAPTHALEELHHPVSRSIHIVPVITGAGGLVKAVLGGAIFAQGRGAGQLIAGSVLVAVGAVTGQPWLISLGASVALGGVAQMLAPTPKAPTPNERPENRPSYYFAGPINTTAQGHPVPLGYGRMIVGSAVISAGIYAEELPASGL